MMMSLRSKLILGSSLISALALIATGFMLFYFVRLNLIAEFDRALVDKAKLLASGAEQKPGTQEIKFHEDDLREFTKKHQASHLQVWLDSGAIVYRSPSAKKAALNLEFHKPPKPECSYFPLPGGRTGRVVYMSFVPSANTDDDSPDDNAGAPPPASFAPNKAQASLVMAVARDTQRITDALKRLGLFLSLCGLATILMTAAVLSFVIRWNLRPLNRVAAQIEQMDELSLALDTEPRQIPAELRPVVERLKGLLQRLNQAFMRERAFSADIAHELRTPLAGLMTAMEVSLSRPRNADTYRATFGECLRIVSQMRNMVEKLLSLAKLESGQTQVIAEPFPLDDAIYKAWKSLENLASERRLIVEWRLDSHLSLNADQDLWELLTRNILENAVCYTNDQGVVRIETRQEDNNIVFYVSNTGSRIRQEETERLFDRLARGDASRSETGVHCGLGLSLVRKSATLLGGRVRIQSRVDGLFEVFVTIPSEN